METMHERDRRLAAQYIGIPWKRLEMEEQAHVRELMRKGILRIEGTGAMRSIAWKG